MSAKSESGRNKKDKDNNKPAVISMSVNVCVCKHVYDYIAVDIKPLGRVCAFACE